MIEDSVINEKIKEIKKDFRLAMNGVVSSIQRNHGLNYKINFGIEIPRLKAIAGKYEKDEFIARRLWQENIRESKILAIFLLPESVYLDIAEEWISEAPFTEIADHLTMNILSKLPNATNMAIEWIQKSEGLFRYCGFMTLTHLFRRGVKFDKEQERIFLATAKEIENIEERKTVIIAAYNSLEHYYNEEEQA